jgi:hypothetical protein
MRGRRSWPGRAAVAHDIALGLAAEPAGFRLRGRGPGVGRRAPVGLEAACKRGKRQSHNEGPQQLVRHGALRSGEKLSRRFESRRPRKSLRRASGPRSRSPGYPNIETGKLGKNAPFRCRDWATLREKNTRLAGFLWSGEARCARETLRRAGMASDRRLGSNGWRRRTCARFFHRQLRIRNAAADCGIVREDV